MIINKYSKILRICDKCKKKSIVKGEIKRSCLYVNIPYYSYMGFDLCIKCLKRFNKMVEKFLNIKLKKEVIPTFNKEIVKKGVEK